MDVLRRPCTQSMLVRCPFSGSGPTVTLLLLDFTGQGILLIGSPIHLEIPTDELTPASLDFHPKTSPVSCSEGTTAPLLLANSSPTAS